MSGFREANQVRVALKMKLCNYAWYSSSAVLAIDDGYCVMVTVKHMDNAVRKTIPPVIDGVSVKVESE
jgi:hypothetical protein